MQNIDLQAKYMQRCLDLAKTGLGDVAPNPMVGCVLVYDDRIIGEGYHEKYGAEHAEVNAINQVVDTTLLKKSTLYVNLEPCAHFGKTPPCADLIIANKIPRVVIGSIDPFSKVKGKGIEKLMKAGIDVTVGVLENECLELNKRFFTFHNKKRPYVILKWAQSKDGFVGKENEANYQISNTESKILSHTWRSQEQAILVGTKTALLDNPNLTTRYASGNSPIRLVIDKQLAIDQNSNLMNQEAKTIVFNNYKNEVKDTIEWVKIEQDNSNYLKQILQQTFDRNIQSIIIEGGSKTLNSFIEANLWDEARIFESSYSIETGVKAPILNLKQTAATKISDNLLYVIKNV